MAVMCNLRQMRAIKLWSQQRTENTKKNRTKVDLKIYIKNVNQQQPKERRGQSGEIDQVKMEQQKMFNVTIKETK